MNLLILEDNHNEAELFIRIADGIFDTVDCVGSIDDLESRTWSKEYGVLLVDLNLIDSRGIPTLSYVREKFGKRPWVVVVTGAIDIDNGSMHEHGANVVIRKDGLSIERLKRELIEAKQAAAMRHIINNSPQRGYHDGGSDVIKKTVQFITNWKIIAGFIASTGIIAAGHQAAYDILGKPRVQEQIDSSLKPIEERLKTVEVWAELNREYSYKASKGIEAILPDSITRKIDSDYKDLKKRGFK